MAIVLFATLGYLRLDPDTSAVAGRLARALDPRVTPNLLVDGIRNTLLFAGWGAVWVLTARRPADLRAVAAATGTAALLSLSVELAQLFSPVRTTSIVDLLTNAGGGLLGALGAVAAERATRRARSRPTYLGVPAAFFAASYSAAALLEGFAPHFRQVNPPLAYGGASTRFAAALGQLRADPLLHFPLLDALLFAPAGALCVMALAEWRIMGGPAVRRVVLGALGCLALVQLGRGVVGQPFEPGAAVAQLAGVACGALAASRWLPELSRRLRGHARRLEAARAYALVLALWSWRPFIPRFQGFGEQFTRDHFIPLAALSQRVDLYSAADIGALCFLFAPAGALLAVWQLRPRGALAGILPALYLAVLLEAGQILVRGRFLDSTDVLICCAGTALGWLLVRRTGTAGSHRGTEAQR
ncbi:MAG TPA: VanZ family protein [Longimicrobium sp.]